MLSIDIIPVATDEAVNEMQKKIMAVEGDITRWQQRQNQNNNFTANIPYDMEQMRKETKEFLDDLTTRDQRMMMGLVTLTHLADSVEQLNEDTEALQAMQIDTKTGKDKYQTDPVPEGKPIPVEPQDAVITDKACTCTLSISCNTINANLSWLDPEKLELVPEDGWILKPTQVTFYEGESVFNVLLRTCKQQKIHMEYENTPIYNSAYIEGIHNLYEFDCGELSGWMYKVNDWFPNYGCSRYQLLDGDTVEWVYTCNLGVDVGGYYSTGG